MHNSKTVRHIGLAGVSIALALFAGEAHAQTNLVTNGGFETLSNPGVSTEIGGTGSYGNVAQNVTGWNSAGYGFVYVPNASAVSGTTADTTGAYFPSLNQQTYLWGPGTGATSDGTAGTNAASNGTDNGLTGVTNGLTNSPNGGNFVALDGSAGLTGPLTQTITGLQGGGVYKLTFFWAAAEQAATAYEAATTEKFTVSLGNTTQTTTTLNDVAQGFTGWQVSTLYFEAGSGSSQVLSFLAAGTPNGAPPFALLDGVSLVLAPEPATWAMMLAGFAGLMLLGRMGARRAGACGLTLAV